MVKQEIGDKKYDELESVVIDMIEMFVDISKNKIKLELNKRGWGCLP